jgi:hypothetical protein
MLNEGCQRTLNKHLKMGRPLGCEYCAYELMCLWLSGSENEGMNCINKKYKSARRAD